MANKVNNANKKILLVAYFFPPIGMGGVGRSFGLYNHLPKYGYHTSVITVKNIAYQNHDDSLLNGIDKSNIIRTGSLDPSRILYLLGKRGGDAKKGSAFKKSFLTWPDYKRCWVPFAQKAAENEILKGNCFAIITTSPAPSAHLIGLRLKKKYNIPWIADFRDLWYSLPIEEIYHTKMQEKYALNLKNEIVKSADRVVTVNNSISEYLNAEKGKAKIIYNGFDSKYRDNWNPQNTTTDKFRIGILGTINELCPIEPLLNAVSLLQNQYPELRDKLNIIHVGQIESNINRLILKYGLQNNVSLKGYMSKGDAISELAVSDLLYFHVKEQKRFQILPGRLFDLLASGKPMIGIAPEKSDASALIEEYKCGICLNNPEPQKIADALYDIYAKKQRREKSSLSNGDDSIIYSTERMARKFAELLDQIV